jgi:hypothetical protein
LFNLGGSPWGLGVNASAGDANIGNDQVEDFTRPSAGPSCVLAVSRLRMIIS